MTSQILALGFTKNAKNKIFKKHINLLKATFFKNSSKFIPV